MDKAVCDNDVTLLKRILQQSDGRGEIIITRTRAFVEAAERDHVECLLWLSSYTASEDQYKNVEDFYWGPLDDLLTLRQFQLPSLSAVRANSFRCARVFYAIGYDPNLVPVGHERLVGDKPHDLPPVKLAVRNNNPEMARILLEAGAYIGDVDCMMDENNTEVMEVLKDPGILDLNYYHMTNSQLKSQLEALPKEYQCTVLLLNNNQLTYLPDLTQYPQFNELQVLNVNYNKLTEIREEHIPQTVHTVYFNYNEMMYISPRLLNLSAPGKMHNGLLSVTGNKLQQIPDTAMVTDKIEFLYLVNNCIHTVANIPDGLKALNLRGNPVETLEAESVATPELYDMTRRSFRDDEALKQPPQFVFQRGYKAVRAYFNDLLIERARNSKNR